MTSLGGVESMLVDGGFEFGVPLLLARPERFATKIGHFCRFLGYRIFFGEEFFPCDF